MSKINFIKTNLISYLFFIISPLVGLIYSFAKIDNKKSRNCFYIIVSLFFGLFCLKNPPVHDIYRYYLQYEYLHSINDFGRYTNDYFFDIICLIFNHIGIPFFFIPPLFVFLTLFTTLKALDKIIIKYEFKKYNSTILITSTIILTNPILTSLGLRSYLGFSFLFLGIINFYLLKNKIYFLFFFLSVLTHSSFLVFLLPLFLMNFFKPNKSITILIFFIFLLFSKILINFITSFSLVNFFNESLIAYTEFKNTDNKSFNGLIHYYLNINLKFFIIFLTMLSINLKKLDAFQLNLFYYMNYMIIICGLCSVSDIALGRYSTYTFFISFILLFLCRKNFIIFNKTSFYILLTYILFSLLVNNIYINRHIFLIGKPLEMSLVTPLNLILYTNDEYKLYFNNIDIDGYPKSGPGSQH